MYQKSRIGELVQSNFITGFQSFFEISVGVH